MIEIIGEKINGSIPSVAKAIKEKDEEKIKHLAKIQADTGAAFIDCCASVEEASYPADYSSILNISTGDDVLANIDLAGCIILKGVMVDS